MLAQTPLFVDVYDALWNKLGDGPVPITSASVSRAFDGAGSFSFEAPANDKRVIELLKDQRRIKILYNDPQTNTVRVLGSGIISKRGRKYAANGNQKSFSGPDTLDELIKRMALPNTIFTNEDISDVASTLAARAGWQAETETDLSNLITARFDGASILKCLRTMTEKAGLHIREKVDIPSDRDRIIEIGRFRTDIELYIQNGEAFTSAVFDNTEIAFIDSLTITHESDDIVNWIIPIGGGEGEAALTLEHAARTSTYPRETVENGGKTHYYKQNEVSINKYGIHEKMLTVKDVSPVGNSITATGYAADVLDEAADAFLDRSGEPQIVYRLSIKKGSKLIRPGDVVHVSFRGAVRDEDGQEIEDETVEGTFYVLKVTENVSGSGVTINLEISNVDKQPDSMESYILTAVEDIQLRNVKPMTYPFRESYSIERPVQQWDGQSSYTRTCILPLKVDSTVTSITSVRLTIRSRPIYTLSVHLGSTNPQNTYHIPIPNKYPQDLSLYINGIDVTSAFGGPWNPSPSGNSAVDETLDITDYIVNASGGFQQNHTIEVRVSMQTRDVSVVGFDSLAPRTAVYGNQGMVELIAVTQGVCQAIAAA